jgi:anti-anti-sigma factor
VALRVEGGLFFADADHVRDVVRTSARADGVHRIVLDARTVPFVDVSAARMLVELTTTLAAGGVELVIARDIGQVRDVLRETDGPAPRVFTEVDAAVAAPLDGASETGASSTTGADDVDGANHGCTPVPSSAAEARARCSTAGASGEPSTPTTTPPSGRGGGADSSTTRTGHDAASITASRVVPPPSPAGGAARPERGGRRGRRRPRARGHGHRSHSNESP